MEAAQDQPDSPSNRRSQRPSIPQMRAILYRVCCTAADIFVRLDRLCVELRALQTQTDMLEDQWTGFRTLATAAIATFINGFQEAYSRIYALEARLYRMARRACRKYRSVIALLGHMLASTPSTNLLARSDTTTKRS